MLEVLAQMAALIACGVVWRWLSPAGFDVDTSRRVLTGLVYVLLLPALVLLVLWQAPLGLGTIRIAVVALSCVVSAMVIALLVYRYVGPSKGASGALILASAFPNATYLGLPVLEKTFGAWARSVAIQFDLFACTPLLLTAGILIARVYGKESIRQNILLSLLKVPPLWAALVAVLLNVNGVPLPSWLHTWLNSLAVAVVPLMLIALGMSLQWHSLRTASLSLMWPVILIQLLLMPLLGWHMAQWLGLTGEMLLAVTLEAAMPSMVLGLVFCDRFHLDSSLYATAVTLTTLISIISLPLWFHGLS